MEVLLLTFANDREHPLPTLAAECTALDKILASRVSRGDFIPRIIPQASLDQIVDSIGVHLDGLSLFLFSGHAGRDHLHTESGKMRSEGIAYLLGKCKNLKVVILNGCSTYGQVRALHDAGVPLVIATSAPIGDDIATQFSIRLFEILETGLNIKEAFEIAIGGALSRKDLQIDRAAELPEDKTEDEPLWGFKPNRDKPDASGWKLPMHSSFSLPADFKVNEILLNALYETFSTTNPALSKLRKEGKTLKNSFGETRLAILTALPAPVGEHLRKLVAASGGEDVGKISLPRLLKLALVYESTMRFLANLLLAQLWENQISDPKYWTLPPAIRSKLKSVIDDEVGTNHFVILQSLQDAVECHCPNPFINELLTFRKNFLEDKETCDACRFLENLPRLSVTLATHEIPELCFRAEENLAVFFSKLGFLGRYVLATVRNIDVQKYRSKKDIEYEHNLAKWHDAVGSCEPSTLKKPYLLDNRSVILLLHESSPEKNTQSYPYLSLAPFIIDQNTYYSEEKVDYNVVSLYLFIRRDTKSGSLHYVFVNNPERGQFDIGANNTNNKEEDVKIYELTQGQFEEFYSTIVNPPILDAL